MALSTDHSEPTEHPDGLGNNRLMAGTSHHIGLGTAALLMMGLTHRVSGTARAVSAQANGMPETMRLCANSTPSKSGHVAHTVEVPMVVEISSERCYDAQTLRDEEAQEHGFATAKAWRKELGLKKDEAATIYSYPVALTASNELPHDRDRAGSRLNAIMDAAYDAWRSGGDKSIKRARKYFEAQPEEIRAEAFQRIAPYKALSGENRIEWLSAKGKQLHANGASMDELRAHQLPSDVRAQRIFEPELTPEPAAEKGPRPKRGHQRLDSGDGWSIQYAPKQKPAEEQTPAPAESPDALKQTHVAKLGKRDARSGAHRRAIVRGDRTQSNLDPKSIEGVSPETNGAVIARASAALQARDQGEARRARFRPRKRDEDDADLDGGGEHPTDNPLKSSRSR